MGMCHWDPGTLPEGVLPYMGYIGMCRCEGYGFQAVYSRIGYINQGPVPRKMVKFNQGLSQISSTVFSSKNM